MSMIKLACHESLWIAPILLQVRRNSDAEGPPSMTAKNASLEKELLHGRELSSLLTEVSDGAVLPGIIHSLVRANTIYKPHRHGLSQNEFFILADVCVQTVGIIQLCEQVAHETPPEQGVPDSQPKVCASVGTH